MDAIDRRPKEISVIREAMAVRIEWNGGMVSEYSWEYLRRKCPCATCAKNDSGNAESRRILTKSQTTIRDVKPVGRYALRFEWQDGHNSGIYSYGYLRGLTPDSGSPAGT